MEQQFGIINQCLHLLKQSDLPAIKKLRTEIQLIQVKRLLLKDGLSNDMKCGPGGEDMFDGLLCQMRKMCGSNCDHDALTEVMDRIGGVIAALGGKELR